MSEISCSSIDLTDNYQHDLLDDLNKEEIYFEPNDNNTLDSYIGILGLSDEGLCSQEIESSSNQFSPVCDFYCYLNWEI
jgi:hypothetical protein